jgi:hypothetical protein
LVYVAGASAWFVVGVKQWTMLFLLNLLL